jgi:hypothetical protein
LVTLWAWLMLQPNTGFLPQISHSIAMAILLKLFDRRCGLVKHLAYEGGIVHGKLVNTKKNLTPVHPSRQLVVDKNNKVIYLVIMVLKIIGLGLVAFGVFLVFCPSFGKGGICEDILGPKHTGKKKNNLGLAKHSH